METIIVGVAGIGLGAMVSRQQKGFRTVDEVMEIKDAMEEIRDAQDSVQVQAINGLRGDIRGLQCPVVELSQTVGRVQQEVRAVRGVVGEIKSLRTSTSPQKMVV